MKKIISVIIAIVVCLSLVGVVMAAEGVFTPSVTYKGQPDVTAVEGAEGTGCLRIVPYAEREALLSADEAHPLPYSEILQKWIHLQDHQTQ